MLARQASLPKGELLRIDFSPSEKPLHKVRVSAIVVGLGLLLCVSALNPYQSPPFGGHHYLQWLAAIIVVLGIASLARRERGHLALASAMVTVAAGGLLVVTLLIAFGSVIALKLFMSE